MVDIFFRLSFVSAKMATYTLFKPQPLLFTSSSSSSSSSIGGRKKKKSVVHVSATVNASVASPANEEGRLERPRWAGETPLPRLVGTLISFKPLYSLMKLGARRVLISTAEKSNVPWREMTRQILESDVYQELETVSNPLSEAVPRV